VLIWIDVEYTASPPALSTANLPWTGSVSWVSSQRETPSPEGALRRPAQP